MKYFSAFSGVGSPEKAIQNLGGEFSCVGFSEIDKFATETYLKNFPNHKPFGDGCRRLRPSDDENVGTLTTSAISKDSLIGRGREIRRLTPVECERLQGFPDGWTDGVSETQRYKQMGNSISVPVILEILKKIK